MNQTQLQNILDLGGEVTFPRGEHEISGSLLIRSDTWLSAPDVILRKRGRYGAITGLQTGSENVRISGVSIDCMGEAFNGITIYGSRNIIEDVTVRNHISPVYQGDTWQQEAFGILIDANPEPGTQNLVQRCEIRDFAGDYNGGIVIAGKAGTSGVIRNCIYRGSGHAKFPRDMEGVMAATIVQDCEWYDTSLGVYTEGLPEMTITNCHFINVRNASVKVNLEFSAQKILTMQGCYCSAPVVSTSMTNKLQFLTLVGNEFTCPQWLSLNGIQNVNLIGNTFPTKGKATFARTKGHAHQNYSADRKWILDGKVNAALKPKRV